MIKVLQYSITFLAIAPFSKGVQTDEWYQECQDDECGYTGISRSALGACQDDSVAGCRKRSLMGECQGNPEAMRSSCGRSCGFCQPSEPSDEPCQDLHAYCPQWASQMECFTNPAFMSRSCPKSCWLCVNASELRVNGVPEEDILRRFNFSLTDFGLWQLIPDRDNAGKIRDAIKAMGSYAMGLQKLGAGILCNNVHHECSQWAVELGSCETNLSFMLSRCSLACHFCHVVEEYHRCKLSQGADERIPVGDMATIRSVLFSNTKANNLLEGFQDLQGDEWIASFEHSRLWKQPEKGLQELVKFISKTDTLEWKDTGPERSWEGLHPERSKRSGRTAICDLKCQKSASSISSLVVDTAELLGISPGYFEPLEFVHFRRGERFTARSDFRIHDSWRHAGSRMVTVFVVLQKAKDGGSIGFPEYDWLQVEDPEVLVWPIVHRETKAAFRRMKSEQLPVVEGELYGVYVRVRQFPFDNGNPCA
jgi:ShK domain-like